MTADNPRGASPAALVPPRPNLGPEPLPEPIPPWGWFAVVAVPVGLIVLLARRRRLRRVRPIAPTGRIDPASPLSPPKPGEEIVGLAETARAAMVELFGPTWRAKTTEEIADDPAAAKAFGPEVAGRLVDLLREADRSKFAAARPDVQGDDADAWALWVAGFVAEAGARSTIKGK